MSQDRGRRYKRPMVMEVKKGQKEQRSVRTNCSVIPFYTESPAMDGTIAMFIAPISGTVSKIKIFVESMNIESLTASAAITQPNGLCIEGKMELKVGLVSLEEPFTLPEGSILTLKVVDYDNQAVEIKHIAAAVIFNGG